MSTENTTSNLPKTIEIDGKVKEYNVDAAVEQFNRKGTLPWTKIYCTKTHTPITMFGTNLEKRVKKYGDIRTLLTTFVCRDAAKADKKAVVETVKNPPTAETPSEIPVNEVPTSEEPLEIIVGIEVGGELTTNPKKMKELLAQAA